MFAAVKKDEDEVKTPPQEASKWLLKWKQVVLNLCIIQTPQILFELGTPNLFDSCLNIDSIPQINIMTENLLAHNNNASHCEAVCPDPPTGWEPLLNIP